MTVLKGMDLVFCRMSLNWGLSNILLMSRLKLLFCLFLRKITTVAKCPCGFSSRHILPGGAWDPQGITADISIRHLVQDRSYWVSLTAGSWRGVRKTSPTVKGEREDSCSHPGYGGCLRGIFGILLEGMFVVLAFIHLSSFISECTHG